MNEFEVLENGNVRITIPIELRVRAGRRRVLFAGQDVPDVDPLVMTLARAFRWQALIDSGAFRNAGELAHAVGKDPAYIARTLRMTLLAPEIVHAILAGTLKTAISQDRLRHEMPMNWEAQKKLFGVQ